MRAAEHWKDFEVLDTSGGEKLERWGNVILARPDPQIIWNTPKGDFWKKINARYLRSRSRPPTGISPWSRFAGRAAPSGC